MLTAHAFKHLGLAAPARDPAQFGLFGNGTSEETLLAWFRAGRQWTASNRIATNRH